MSVIASLLAVTLATQAGFSSVLLLAVFLYVGAGLTFPAARPQETICQGEPAYGTPNPLVLKPLGAHK